MTRVRITGGPWPERIGCTGVVVPAPRVPRLTYPWADLPNSHLIILLDKDPVAGPSLTLGRLWSCCMEWSDVEVVQPH